MDAIRIELISNTCKVLILPLNYATKWLITIPNKIGLTGIEPITFRYERNILPLNYRIIKFLYIKIAKKSYCMLLGRLKEVDHLPPFLEVSF